jgi:glycosyltransferase involved in cell wall biosynthesis
MISVLILTLNEERNLARCLDAVRWSDDVVVFDSGSTDATLDIARDAGARIVVRPFDNERFHRTASLEVGFRYPWVFNPDADEVPEPDLVREMQDVVRDERRRQVAYRVRFKNIFMNRWLRYSSLYPTWIMRLFRPETISFERNINLHYVVNGEEGRLGGHLRHYSFENGLHAWFEKHNRYSTAEAQEAIRLFASGQGVRWRDLLSGDAVTRRRGIKELSFRLPFRGGMRFIYSYFLHLGFLDGYPGYLYCRMLAIYEFMIALKIQEYRSANSEADNRSIATVDHS